jgi:hypothetical protein
MKDLKPTAEKFDEVIQLRRELAELEVSLTTLRDEGAIAVAKARAATVRELIGQCTGNVCVSIDDVLPDIGAIKERVRLRHELEAAKLARAALRRELRQLKQNREVLDAIGDYLGEAYATSIDWLESSIEESESEVNRLARKVRELETAQ